MALREKREIPIRPLILKFGVAFAVSLGGVLYTIFRTKRSKTPKSEDTQPSTDCCNHSDSRGGSFGLVEDDRALKALKNGLTDGADKGEEDSDGWSALPFACGYGEEKREMLEDKRERGGSSRGGADADDGQSILIVNTYHYLLVLDLKGKQKPIDESHCNPVLLRKINLFEDGGFLSGMGILKLENNRIYMFGGSRKWLTTFAKKSRFNRKRYCKQTVYELNSRSWSLRLTDKVDDTKAPKADPWVANVDGKILVLEGEIGFKGISQPFLEFYDLTSNTWKEFPKIPTQESWSKEQEAIIMSGKHSAVLLVGYRLYITFGDSNSELFFCLNTRTQEWEEENASNFRESFRKFSIYFPDLGRSVSRIDGLGDGLNIILHHIRNSIYAYLIDDSGSLLCYQDLTDELCCDIIPDPFDGVLFIDLKSGGGMCMVLIDHPGLVVKWGSYQENSIFIRHFELKFKKDFKVPLENMNVPGGLKRHDFVKVGSFKDQRCTIPGVCETDLWLRDAVLL